MCIYEKFQYVALAYSYSGKMLSLIYQKHLIVFRMNCYQQNYMHMVSVEMLLN